MMPQKKQSTTVLFECVFTLVYGQAMQAPAVDWLCSAPASLTDSSQVRIVHFEVLSISERLGDVC